MPLLDHFRESFGGPTKWVGRGANGATQRPLARSRLATHCPLRRKRLWISRIYQNNPLLLLL